MTQKELVEISREYFEKMVKAGLTVVICRWAPFFLLKPWSIVLDKVLDILVSALSNVLDKGAFFVYTDLRVNVDGRAFVAAKMAYKNARTEEERKKYEDEIVKALNKLVSFR